MQDKKAFKPRYTKEDILNLASYVEYTPNKNWCEGLNIFNTVWDKVSPEELRHVLRCVNSDDFKSDKQQIKALDRANSINGVLGYIRDAYTSINDSKKAYFEYRTKHLAEVYETIQNNGGVPTLRDSSVEDLFSVQAIGKQIRATNGDKEQAYEIVKKEMLSAIDELRTEHYRDNEVSKVNQEIENCLLNIRDYRLSMLEGNTVDFVISATSVDFTPLNQVTITPSNSKNAASIVDDTVKVEFNRVYSRTLLEVVDAIKSPYVMDKYKRYMHVARRLESEGDFAEAENVRKKAKSGGLNVVFSTNNGLRPHKDIGDYEFWSGFQVFDLDIKNNEGRVNVANVKMLLHTALQKYHWYVGGKFSVSGKGIHLLTKVTPPNALETREETKYHNQFWFMISYFQKFAVIKDVLINICKLNKETIHEVIDKAMMKVHQGGIINYDKNFLTNDNFADMPLYVDYFGSVTGAKVSEFMTTTENFDALFARKAVVSASTGRRTLTHEVIQHRKATVAYKFDTKSLPDINLLKPFDDQKLKKGKRDYIRSVICRTAVGVFGASEYTYDLLKKLLCSKNTWTENELMGKFQYACSNSQVTEVGLDILKSCGCRTIIRNEREVKMAEAAEMLRTSIIDESNFVPDYSIDLKPDEYLGTYSEDIIEKCQRNRINLLEARPGIGKTVFVKQLAENYRVLVVEPYRSIIINKIETDDNLMKYFKALYDDRVYDPAETCSYVMTTDKFSKLDKSELLKFHVIAIDESHLIFTEDYRSDVNGRVIRNLTQHIENTEYYGGEIMAERLFNNHPFAAASRHALEEQLGTDQNPKIILMTGTPTGERLFFDREDRKVNHIQVNKKPDHTKTATLVLAENQRHKDFLMIKTIADFLEQGKRIIMPSNRGDAYYDSVVARVNRMLPEDKRLTPDQYDYYKKSNTHRKATKAINDGAKLPDSIRFLMASTYLGAGVDIDNRDNFEFIIDGDKFPVQYIEQFNSRIRKDKINSNVFFTTLHEDKRKKRVMIEKKFEQKEVRISKIDFEAIKDEMEDDAMLSQFRRELESKSNFKVKDLVGFIAQQSRYHYYGRDGEIHMKEERVMVDDYSKKFNEILCKPTITRSILEDKYNYNIKVVSYTYKHEEEEITKDLDEVGKAAEVEYRKQYGSILESFVVCHATPKYEALLKRPTTDYEIEETDELYFDVRQFLEPDTHLEIVDRTIKVRIPSRLVSVFKDAVKDAKMLLAKYQPETVGMLIATLKNKNGVVRRVERQRVFDMFRMLVNNKYKRLGLDFIDSLGILNGVLDKPWPESKTDGILYEPRDRMVICPQVLEELKVALASYGMKYYFDGVGKTLKSRTYLERFQYEIESFIQTVLPYTYNAKQNVYIMERRRLPFFDSSASIMSDEMEEKVRRFLIPKNMIGKYEIPPRTEREQKQHMLKRFLKMGHTNRETTDIIRGYKHDYIHKRITMDEYKRLVEEAHKNMLDSVE